MRSYTGSGQSTAPPSALDAYVCGIDSLRAIAGLPDLEAGTPDYRIDDWHTSVQKTRERFP